MTPDQNAFRQTVAEAIPDEATRALFLELMDEQAIYVDARGYVYLTFEAENALAEDKGKETFIQ